VLKYSTMLAATKRVRQTRRPASITSLILGCAS
jgi:hypothetical protein